MTFEALGCFVLYYLEYIQQINGYFPLTRLTTCVQIVITYMFH